MNLFWCKANVKCFGFNNLHQDFDIIRIVHIAIDACCDNWSKGNVYNKKYFSFIYIYIFFFFSHTHTFYFYISCIAHYLKKKNSYVCERERYESTIKEIGLLSVEQYKS